MKEMNYELCVKLAQKRLCDIITAVNKADPFEVYELVTRPIVIDSAENKVVFEPIRDELTFRYKEHRFLVTFDVVLNGKDTDIYHIWKLPNSAEDIIQHVVFLYGASDIKDLLRKGNIDEQHFDLRPIETFIESNALTYIDEYLDVSVEVQYE